MSDQDNINTLRITELEKRFALKVAELEQRLLQQSTYQEKAVEMAAQGLKERLHGMNEFRAQLNEQIREFIPRSEYNVHHEGILLRMNALEKLVANAQGRFWALGLAAALTGGLLGTMGALLLRAVGVGGH